MSKASNLFLAGDDAIAHIPYLFSKFSKSRLDAFLRHYDLTADNYDFHPILTQTVAALEMPRYQVERLLMKRETGKLVTKREELALRSQLFSSHQNIDVFEGGAYFINIDIEESKDEYIGEMSRALDLIKCHGGWMNILFQKVVHEIVPVTNGEGSLRASAGFSCFALIGTIFISLMEKPNAVPELAISLAHELSHHVLDLLILGQHPIAEEDWGKWVYSGFRKTDRPAIMSLQAAMALSYMIVICDRIKDSSLLTNSEKDYVKKSLKDYIVYLGQGVKALESLRMSPLGDRVLQDFRAIRDGAR